VFEPWEEHFSKKYFTNKKNCDNSYLVSIDEAGRGSLFGPVTVGGILIPINEIYSLTNIEWYNQIKDSKKLNISIREKLYSLINTKFNFAFSHISVKFIDTYNINRAIQYGIYRLIKQLSRQLNTTQNKDKISFVLLDGKYNFSYPAVGMSDPMPVIFDLVNGDNLSFSIACASIIAKVTRDKLMLKAAKRFPDYDLHKNMGYGTLSHRTAIKKLGCTTFHRKTFIKKIVKSDNL